MILSSLVLVLCSFFFGHGVSEHELLFNGKFGPKFNSLVEEGSQRKHPTKCLKGKTCCLGQKSIDDKDYGPRLRNALDSLRPVFDKRGDTDKSSHLFSSLSNSLLAGKPCCQNKNETRIFYYRNYNTKASSPTILKSANTRKRRNKQRQSKHSSKICKNCKSLNIYKDLYMNRMIRKCAFLNFYNPTNKIKCIVIRQKNNNNNALSYNRNEQIIRAKTSSNYITNKLNDHSRRLKELYESLFGKKKSAKEESKFGRYKIPSKVMYSDGRETSDVTHPGYGSSNYITNKLNDHSQNLNKLYESLFGNNKLTKEDEIKLGRYKIPSKVMYSHGRETSNVSRPGYGSSNYITNKLNDHSQNLNKLYESLFGNNKSTKEERKFGRYKIPSKVIYSDGRETSDLTHPGYGSSNYITNKLNDHSQNLNKLYESLFGNNKLTKEGESKFGRYNIPRKVMYSDGRETADVTNPSYGSSNYITNKPNDHSQNLNKLYESLFGNNKSTKEESKFGRYKIPSKVIYSDGRETSDLTHPGYGSSNYITNKLNDHSQNLNKLYESLLGKNKSTKEDELKLGRYKIPSNVMYSDGKETADVTNPGYGSSTYITNKLNDHSQNLNKLYESLFGNNKLTKEDEIKLGRYKIPSKVMYSDGRETSNVSRPGYGSNSHDTGEYPDETRASEENHPDLSYNSLGIIKYPNEKGTSEGKRFEFSSNSHGSDKYPDEERTSEENHPDLSSNSHGSFTNSDLEGTSEIKHPGLSSNSHSSFKNPHEKGTKDDRFVLSSNSNSSVKYLDKEGTPEETHNGLSSNSHVKVTNPVRKGNSEGKGPGFSTYNHGSFKYSDDKYSVAEDKRFGLSSNSHDSFKYPDKEETSERKYNDLSSNSHGSAAYPVGKETSVGKHPGFNTNNYGSFNHSDGNKTSEGKRLGLSSNSHSSVKYPDKKGTLEGKPSGLSSNSNVSVTHPNGKRTSEGKHPGLSSNTHGSGNHPNGKRTSEGKHRGLSSNTHGGGKYSHEEGNSEEKRTDSFQGVEWTLNKTHLTTAQSSDREGTYEENRRGLASNSQGEGLYRDVEETLNKTYAGSDFSSSNTNTGINASSARAGNVNTATKMNSLASLFNKSDISELDLSEINDLIMYLIQIKTQLSVNGRGSNDTVAQEEKKHLIQTKTGAEENFSSSNRMNCDENCDKVDGLLKQVLRFRKHLSNTYNVR